MTKENDWLAFSQQYFDIISTKYAGLNLTALKNVEDIYQKQVLDSILPVKNIPIMKKQLEEAKYIVDFGTGGGFPLLPIASLYPSKTCVGVDARAKKLSAVLEISKMFGLKNVGAIHSRFDELLFDKPGVVILVKAVGKIADIVEQIQTDYPLDIFFYKGVNFYDIEIEQLEKLNNNGQLVNVFDISVEGLEKRYVAHCRMTKIVPRGTKAALQKKIFSKMI